MRKPEKICKSVLSLRGVFSDWIENFSNSRWFGSPQLWLVEHHLAVAFNWSTSYDVSTLHVPGRCEMSTCSLCNIVAVRKCQRPNFQELRNLNVSNYNGFCCFTFTRSDFVDPKIYFDPNNIYILWKPVEFPAQWYNFHSNRITLRISFPSTWGALVIIAVHLRPWICFVPWFLDGIGKTWVYPVMCLSSTKDPIFDISWFSFSHSCCSSTNNSQTVPNAQKVHDSSVSGCSPATVSLFDLEFVWYLSTGSVWDPIFPNFRGLKGCEHHLGLEHRSRSEFTWFRGQVQQDYTHRSLGDMVLIPSNFVVPSAQSHNPTQGRILSIRFCTKCD